MDPSRHSGGSRAEPEYRSVARSIFGGDPEGESYALVTFCNYVVAFLKLSETDPTIGLILIAIEIEACYRSVARSLSERGPKGEPNALIVAESEVTDFLMWRRSCSCSSGLL
jgi:hypothetical protein